MRRRKTLLLVLGINEKSSFNLFCVYKTNLNDYYLYLSTKKTTPRYNQDLKYYCAKFFSNSIDSLLDFRREYHKSELSPKYLSLALRSWFSFCEDAELIDNILLVKLRKIVKKKSYEKIDTHVPSPQEVSRSVEIVFVS